jgi:hypothetical protein
LEEQPVAAARAKASRGAAAARRIIRTRVAGRAAL